MPWYAICMAQWWERSPPTIVARVRFPDSTSYVGWVCCWLSSPLRGFFSGFCLPPQKATFLYSNSTWNARTPLNEFLELFGASWVNKLHLHLSPYLSGFLLQSDRLKQVKTIENSPLGLSKGWPRPLYWGDRLMEVKITIIKRPVRVKGGMSLRNGMWHDLRHGIILCEVRYLWNDLKK